MAVQANGGVLMGQRVARTAGGLPAGRRENYVWRHCWVEGFSLELELDDGRPEFTTLCGDAERWLKTHRVPDRAVVGDDGLYHLVAGRRVVCGVRSDPLRCRFGEQAAVAQQDAVADLAAVPIGQRCVAARPFWPAPTQGSGALAVVRRRLVAALGAGCGTCGNPWATRIDHDHLTGEVRGYLCGVCNNAVDRCRHLEQCPYADYLSAPPATNLRLRYPYQRTGRYAARRRCFEIVMSGGMSPGEVAAATETGN